jgi:hypothetical protein
VIDYKTARAIGVSREAPPQLIAEYLCRQADSRPIGTLSTQAAEWLAKLASALGSHLPDQHETRWTADTPPPCMPIEAIAKETAAVHGGHLRRQDSPTVLAAVAPDVIVGGCPARELDKMCRALVGRQLETFCLRILEKWEQEGYIRND